MIEGAEPRRKHLVLLAGIVSMVAAHPLVGNSVTAEVVLTVAFAALCVYVFIVVLRRRRLRTLALAVAQLVGFKLAQSIRGHPDEGGDPPGGHRP